MFQKDGDSMGQRTRSRVSGRDLGQTKAQQIIHDFEPAEDGIGFEKPLSFDRSESDRLRERIDQAHGFDLIESGDRSLAEFASVQMSNQALEPSQEIPSLVFEVREGVRARRQFVDEDFDACRPVESISRPLLFFEDSKSIRSVKHDLEGAIRSLLSVGDMSDTADVEERGIARHLVDVFGRDGDHSDLTGVGENVLGQLTVAGLEEDQRNGDLGQEHDISQRKEGQRFDRFHSRGV